MGTDALRAVVDQHSCSIGQTRYVFKLKWVAIQKDCDPFLARQLLLIDVTATSNRSQTRVPLHVFTRIWPVDELPSLLDAALQQRLADQRGGRHLKG